MYVRDIIKRTAPQIYNAYEKGCSNNKMDVILYGAGEKARLFLNEYHDINVKLCCDDNPDKIGKYLDNIKIVSMDELKLSHNDLPIIVTSKWSDDISRKLKHLGLNYVYHRFCLEYLMHMDMLEDVFNQLEDDISKKVFLGLVRYVFEQNPEVFESITFDENQYFLQDIFKFVNNEAIIDGGAFTGDTLEKYVVLSKGKFEKYCCFEPDKGNFDLLGKYVNSLEQRDKIEIYNYGLFSKEGKVHFSCLNTSASCINPFSTSCIKVIDADKLFRNEDVTMIKMDIEGSEYEALIGSRETIIRTKPKLAICVYHLASDLWKIPLLIKSFDKNYKLYLRHHNRKCWYETVLYATL